MPHHFALLAPSCQIAAKHVLLHSVDGLIDLLLWEQL